GHGERVKGEAFPLCRGYEPRAASPAGEQRRTRTPPARPAPARKRRARPAQLGMALPLAAMPERCAGDADQARRCARFLSEFFAGRCVACGGLLRRPGGTLGCRETTTRQAGPEAI